LIKAAIALFLGIHGNGHDNGTARSRLGLAPQFAKPRPEQFGHLGLAVKLHVVNHFAQSPAIGAPGNHLGILTGRRPTTALQLGLTIWAEGAIARFATQYAALTKNKIK
jgi:hypothetical protein